MLTLAFRAQKIGRKKVLQINGLNEDYRPVTGNASRCPSIGAAVEFSPRASIGPARD